MTREMVSVVLSLAVVLSGIAALLVGRLLAAAYGLRRSTAVHLLSGMFGAALGIAVLARQVPNAEDAAVPMVLLYTILGALIFTFAINTARWAFSSPHLMGGTDLLLGDSTFASAAAKQRFGETKAAFISYRRDDSLETTGRIYDRLLREFGEAGRRRLDDPRDHVRIEIETALRRNLRVVPLLVGGAEVPSETMLPETLQSLSYRAGTAIRPDPDFHRDIDRLMAGLKA